MKREAKKILPTMKIDADADNELDLAFVECQATIQKVFDVETKKYGNKPALSVIDNDGKEFNVFVNNFSMQNLIDAFGDEDKAWIGKVVSLVKEHDETYNTEMIVIKAVK